MRLLCGQTACGWLPVLASGGNNLLCLMLTQSHPPSPNQPAAAGHDGSMHEHTAAEIQATPLSNPSPAGALLSWSWSPSSA